MYAYVRVTLLLQNYSELRLQNRGAQKGKKEKKLRNLIQTDRGSMRRVHVKAGMLNTRALYWQMLVYTTLLTVIFQVNTFMFVRVIYDP
jgi:hypothetical protein